MIGETFHLFKSMRCLSFLLIEFAKVGTAADNGRKQDHHWDSGLVAG